MKCAVWAVESQYHNCAIKQRDRYDLADKLLDWQCSSEEEKKVLKKKINYIKLYQNFIANAKYESANKFLNWQFATEEERQSCKDNFKSNKFSCDYIYKLWAVGKEDIEVAREKSYKFLNWFLNSEEEIAWFKQEKLIKNDQLEEVLNHEFIGHGHYEIIEDFLYWCLLSQKEIQSLKAVLVDRTILRNCKYDIANGFLDSAERFVQWAFDEEKKRKDFIKKFMTSGDGGLGSCNALIAKASYAGKYKEKPTLEERLTKFNKFIDFWIKPLENLSDVKEKLKVYVYSDNTEEQIENHTIFMSLLDNMESSNEMMDVSYMGEGSNMNR